MARLFDQIVGHKTAQDRLLSAVEMGRLSPTLLLVGPAGIGKKLFSRSLAQALVCEVDRRGCGECPSCRRIERGESEALLHISPSGTQIKIEQSHEILRFLNLRAWGRSRVIIIEEAHRLNLQAANALLKALEEPQEGTYFVLTAVSAYSVLSTIRSRSQIVRLAPLSRSDLGQIPGVEDWMKASCMGRLDVLNQLREPEVITQRQATLRLWSQLAEKAPFEMAREMTEIGKDQDEGLRSSQWARQLIRDALFKREGLVPFIHSDSLPEIDKMSQLDPKILHWLHAELLEIEDGIQRNWDRHLTWDAFFVRANEAMNATKESE